MQYLHQEFACDPAHHLGIALAEGLAGRDLELGPGALFQPQQALLDRGRELAVAQGQRRGLALEGVDDVAEGAREPVVQREEGSRLHPGRGGGHGSPDNLALHFRKSGQGAG